VTTSTSGTLIYGQARQMRLLKVCKQKARCREHTVTPLAAPPAGKIEAQNDGTL